jgi:hypothetical protein
MTIPIATLKRALAVGLLLMAFSACGVGETSPAVRSPDRHALGDANAPVTLVAFDDYQ